MYHVAGRILTRDTQLSPSIHKDNSGIYNTFSDTAAYKGNEWLGRLTVNEIEEDGE